MTRTRLADRVLPNYTRGEEIANMVTHIIGAAFGVVALILCLVSAVIKQDPFRIVSGIVYGMSLILLYTMSSVYHGLKPCMGKKVMQVLDHCTIYILIAGSYTPIVLGPMREMYPFLGWLTFGLVWGISAVAMIFTAIDHKKYGVLSMICYLGLGWMIIFQAGKTIRCISLPGFLYLLAGGLAYTVGAVLYGIAGKKGIHYMHSVFHVFVLVGTALQFVTVLGYCM